MAHQALDAFVAEIGGTPFSVVKGQVFPDNHVLVKLDAGRGLLFAPLDLGDDDPPAPAKAAKGRGA